jgi:hypothetical protein
VQRLLVIRIVLGRQAVQSLLDLANLPEHAHLQLDARIRLLLGCAQANNDTPQPIAQSAMPIAPGFCVAVPASTANSYS